jgi:HAD superfamily hydrolase (TIGR01509 family)
MKIKALLFDFDGLILDTEGPVYRSWLELYQAYGCELPFDIFGAMIGTAEDPFDLLALLEEKIGCALPKAEITRRRHARETALIAVEQVRPGVIETLESARRLGLKLAVVSSSPRRWVESHLTRLGLLDPFERLVTGDTVRRTKPDPELYLAALQALDIHAGQAVAFEDSLLGVRAARAAGIFSVAVPTDLTRRLPLEEADLVLQSLAQPPLEALLATIQNKGTG